MVWSNKSHKKTKATDDNVQVEVSLDANNLFHIHVTEDKKLQSVVKVAPQNKRGLKPTKTAPTRGRSRTATGSSARAVVASSSCPPSLNHRSSVEKKVQVIRDVSCPPSRDQIESLEHSTKQHGRKNNKRANTRRKPNLVAQTASRRRMWRGSHKLIPAL